MKSVISSLLGTVLICAFAVFCMTYNEPIYMHHDNDPPDKAYYPDNPKFVVELRELRPHDVGSGLYWVCFSNDNFLFDRQVILVYSDYYNEYSGYLGDSQAEAIAFAKQFNTYQKCIDFNQAEWVKYLKNKKSLTLYK